MISEFDQLSEKLTQLAALTDSLRRENGELRQFAITVTMENGELSKRMLEAQHRIEALLATLPESSAVEQDQEEAA